MHPEGVFSPFYVNSKRQDVTSKPENIIKEQGRSWCGTQIALDAPNCEVATWVEYGLHSCVFSCADR